MGTNELVLNKLLDVCVEVADLRRERDILRRSVSEWAKSNEEQDEIIDRIEAENDGLLEDVACLKVDLDEAKKTMADLEDVNSKLLAKACKKK